MCFDSVTTVIINTSRKVFINITYLVKKLHQWHTGVRWEHKLKLDVKCMQETVKRGRQIDSTMLHFYRLRSTSLHKNLICTSFFHTV